jgi:predicted Zn-dependent protease
MKLNIILFSSLFVNSAFGFTLSNEGRVKLPSPEVKIIVAGNTCSVAGFNSAQELADMVKESVKEYWNRIPTCALEFEVVGVSASITTTSDTLLAALQKTSVGQILVGCSDNATLFTSTSTLGVGSINTASGDRGTFLINNKDTTFANLTASEKLAVISHELGHAFGLGHSGDAAALMYYAVGGKVQEKLSIDDYDACSYLYPHDSPGSCSGVPIISPSKGDGNSSQTGGLNKKMTLFFVSIFGPFLLAGLFFRGNEWRKLFLPS